MPLDPRRVKALFVAALEQPDPATRAALVDRECGPDHELRQRVERLLAAHDAAASAPGDGPDRTAALDPGPPTAAVPSAGVVGAVIAGRYKLLEAIGEGGMGTVYMADQTDPVRRRVAVKLVRDDRDSNALLARFEAERQAIAVMDHPHIAKLLDAGATADGRPFFVMELVRGVPITDFCDAHRLTVPDRLRLFRQVCGAVQHAHQKGIIHRDLKPSNVLVESHDGRPVPKVIDFGLAKAAGGLRLTDATLFTGFGTVLGTPQYMAPEQAAFTAVDVDTRADVYALGVILYELLAGSPPIRRETLKKAALDEMLRVIREDEPPPPSSRISGSAEKPSIAACRQTEPAKLDRFVKGELDWVVMKALAKDRDRRYDTATAFGADVERFLNHEPVAAGPPTAGYRLRKFVRRNRGRVAAAAAVVVAVLAGLAVSLWQAGRATRAEAAARAGQAVALEERDKADAATREADEQRKVAERQAASTTIDLYDGMSSDASDDGRRAHLLLARLARTLPPHAADLREYITARLVYDLQGVAPLDDRLTGHTASPDGRYVIAHADNGGLGVYEFPSGRRVAGLREGDERDGRVGFGPDGRLAYTLSADGVVRVWDVPTGRLRLRAGPLPFPWHTTAADLGPDRLAVRRVAHPSEPDPRGPNPVWLWDVTEGRFVGRLDGHAGPVDVAFAPDGRAVVTSGRRGGPARVWSAADGRLLAELPHDGPVAEAAFSPSGRRLVTVSDRENGGTVRWWDAGSGRPLGPPLRWDRSPAAGPITPTLFLGEDEAVIRSGEAVAVVRPSGLVAQAPVSGWDVVVDPAARTATDGRRLVRLDTGRVELPGPGRRYHPGAAAFARGGRWLAVPRNLIDLTAEKDLVVYDGWTSTAVSPVPGGYAAHPAADGMSLPARYVPVPNAAVPADLLERWVQVVVCGGLGADEAFVPWDEPTWERHRAELAATPPPLPDFPFPGRVATDRWYWLKRRYKQVEADDAKAFPLLDRLVAAEPKPEWYDRRGNLNARLGRWSAAADDYLAAKADVGAFARGWADKPGEPAEKYRAAVRLAEAARRADPDNWEAASALGMALYRAGRDREAVRALAEASALYRLGESARRVVGPVLLSPWAGLAADPATHDHPTNLAFRAMAHHRLGEADLARARLADLAPALLAHAGSGHPLFDGTDDLRREAEATLAAPPAPAPK